MTGGEAIEASTLGWPPGTWPDTFEHDGTTWCRAYDVVERGQLVAVVYRGDDSRILEVLND